MKNRLEVELNKNLSWILLGQRKYSGVFLQHQSPSSVSCVKFVAQWHSIRSSHW